MHFERRALLALVLLSLIWGYSWIVLKIALLDAGPFAFAALRVLLGAACLFAVLGAAGRPWKPERLGELFVLGLVQTSAYVGLSMWALVEGGPGRTAVLVFTMPFWTLLLAWPALGEKVRGGQWLAILLAGFGLIAILQPWQQAGSIGSKLLAVTAGFIWAVSAIILKRFQARGRMDLLRLTAWQMLLGSLPLLVVAAWVDEQPVIWSARFIAALAFNSAITTAAGWWLWIYVLNHLPAGSAGMSMLAIPVIAILASWLQLGERPPAPELAGMLMIGAALLLVALRAWRLHRDLTPPAAPE
jgi:drug/metabolite transporter (DMT)-like permease